jgi:uncharacterized membrane protein
MSSGVVDFLPLVGIFMIPLAILAFVGLCFLEWYWAKRQDNALGWILPSLSLLVSLYPVFMMSAPPEQSFLALLGTILFVFLLFNIPTVIFLVIRVLARGKRQSKKEIDKMNILDLE